MAMVTNGSGYNDYGYNNYGYKPTLELLGDHLCTFGLKWNSSLRLSVELHLEECQKLML